MSYGKDSLACLFAVEQLGWPLDRIVHAEVWATDDIPADLPPMVEFKAKADRIIKERWGIEVEHVCAMRDGEKLTYEKLFYRIPQRKRRGEDARRKEGSILGFPMLRGQWCTSELKNRALFNASLMRGAQKDAVQYLGIAADEPGRIARHIGRPDIKLPLVEIGWNEAFCRELCEKNDLLSPIYTTATRGGAGFVTTRALASSACCGKIIRSCGSSF